MGYSTSRCQEIERGVRGIVCSHSLRSGPGSYRTASSVLFRLRPGPQSDLATRKTTWGRDSLAARKKAQLEAANQFKVFHQFQFTDKLKESGITFSYHSVDDITKHMRMGHYDHGSAVAVADVDGDGLYDIYFANQVGGNELWKNLGGGKFKNITQEAGVGLPGRISVGAAFADIDNDGSEDLVRHHSSRRQRFIQERWPRTFQGYYPGSGPRALSLTPREHFSSITITTAWSIFWSAMSASTPTTKKDRMASTSGSPTPSTATCTRTVTNIRSSTKTWVTTVSRTLPPKWG